MTVDAKMLDDRTRTEESSYVDTDAKSASYSGLKMKGLKMLYQVDAMYASYSGLKLKGLKLLSNVVSYSGLEMKYLEGVISS
jgi:hypothetical protein